jgi:hypothetical protein
MTAESHRYVVVNLRQKVQYFGDNFESARRVYDRLDSGAMFASKSERPVLSCLRRNGRSRIIIH